MRRKSGSRLYVFLIIGLFGCASATGSVMKTSNETYPPTNPASIKMFLSEKPSQSYKEIGRVSVSKFGNFGTSRSGEEIQQEMKEKAASIGGNAIINVTEDFASTNGVVIIFSK